MKFRYVFLLFIYFLSQFGCCKDDLIVPVTGKVVDKITKNPIENARVVYNATETVDTDKFGEFRLQYNLKCFLADSISLYVTKDKYKDRNFSGVIGNTQKDIFVIEVDPK